MSKKVPLGGTRVNYSQAATASYAADNSPYVQSIRTETPAPADFCTSARRQQRRGWSTLFAELILITVGERQAMPDLHTPYGVLDAMQAHELLRFPADPLHGQVQAYFRRWHAVGFLRCVACG